MSGKTQTISNDTPSIGAVNIQQSSYGLTIPIVWGRTRITGNLIWYGDFVAIPHTTVTQSGGKGGAGGIRQSTTTYDYTAAVMMALCEGPISGVRSAWRGKYVYGGAAVSTKGSRTTETFTVAVTPNTVTQAAVWTSDVVVEYQISPKSSDSNAEWDNLVRDVDYTVTAGVYTFNAMYRGRKVRITYTYTATTATLNALGEIGLSLMPGVTPQTPWGYLTSKHPSEAVGYSGIAYLYASNYALTGNAEVDNHSFEIDAPLQFSSTIPDANPADIFVDFLSNGVYGAGFGYENIGDITAFRNSSTAQGVFLSPALTEQAPAKDFLTKIAQLTNVGLVWSERLLKVIPYYDMPITGNGVTYTPDTAPIYDLTDDDFQPGNDGNPVKVTRRSQADAFNRVQIEYRNRDNAYNVEIMEAKDQADIENSGLRAMATISAHEICDTEVARVVAQLILQRSLYIRNEYEFQLGWSKIGLEPMDLVTITDSGLGLTKQPVRITSIQEDDTGLLTITAEEFPKGSASATLYPSGGGSGFSHDYNAAAGNCYTPVIFEAPAALARSSDSLEVWLATGGGALYGGCEVWTSLDGSNYERTAILNGSSRYGTTTTVLANRSAAGTYSETVGVSLLAGGQILAGSLTDLNSLTTLCFVGGEFLAYQAATLTGANAYTLGPSLSRGAYLSATGSKASGSQFVRCDEALAKIPLTKDYIGKTIYIKLLSFNYYKGATQSLADVTAYNYTVTGAQANLPPIAPPNLALEGPFTIDTAKFKWDGVGNAATYNVQIWDTVGGVMKRQVNVGNALRYDYSADDAKADGGPWRQLTIKVQGINANGAAGAFSTLAVTNSQIGALSNIKIVSGLKSFVFTCDKPTDADYAGIQVHISTTAGFTPSGSTLVYDGPNTSYTITTLQSGTALNDTTTYYIKYAAYDSFDKTGLTFGASAGLLANTVVVNKSATVFLYQWGTVQPNSGAAPSGTSTYTWATASHSAYSGGDGWSTAVPTNPGTPLIKLWVASVSITDYLAATTVNWSAASISAWSQNGANGAAGTDGPKSARATVYQWAATIPSISGSSTYTWSTGLSSPLPSGWFTISGTSPVQGYTLWAASLNITDAGAATTTTINWATASIIAAGYSGGNGLSSRVMYARIAANPTPITGTVNTSGNTSFPTGGVAAGVWGASFNVTWAGTDPDPSSNNSLYVSDGIYNPATGTTSWGTPYISSLKVGNLSAVSVNTGNLTVTGELLVSSTGSFRGGKTSFTDTTAGFWLGYDTTAYKFALGDATNSLSWSGSGLTLKGVIDASGGAKFTLGGTSYVNMVSGLGSPLLSVRKEDNNANPAFSIFDTVTSSQPTVYATSTSTAATFDITNTGGGYSGSYTGKFRLGANTPFVMNTDTGVSGRVLTSAGTANTPTWGKLIMNGGSTADASGNLTVSVAFPDTSYSGVGTSTTGIYVVVTAKSASSITFQAQDRATGAGVSGAAIAWVIVG